MAIEDDSDSELASTDESLRRLARQLTDRSTDADDLAQEVWLSALLKPALLARKEWFRIIARRTVWRWLRRERERSARERAVALGEARTDEGPETTSLREYLTASVDALEPPYREVIRLRYFEDLSVEEIGLRLGRPQVTVRVQLSRGLEELRGRLEHRRRRFLGLSPLLSRWTSKAWRRTRRADRSLVALGASAAICAVVLWAVVAGRAHQRREEAAALPEVASRSGAALEAREPPVPPRRLPITPEPVTPEPRPPESPGARIGLSGRVLDFEGRPIPGAPVYLGDRHARAQVAAVSDGEGRYRVVSADPQDWIEARPAGSLPTPAHLVCSLEQDRELDLVTARPTGTLRGQVRDAEGRPVPRAEVVLGSPRMTSRVGSLLATTLRDELSARASFGRQATVEGSLEPTHCITDGAGRFEALKPPEERLVVLVHARGLPPWLELLETRPGADEQLEVRLAVPGSITGRVLDRAGEPCVGARLELQFPEPQPRLETHSDGEGRFQLGGLGPGPFVLRVTEQRITEQADGSASCNVEGRLLAGQQLQLELELSEQSSIAGTVVADGRPLAGWTVVLWELSDRDFPARDSRQTSTTRDGRFAFPGCSEKPYDLEFFDPDAPAERHRITTRAGRSPLILEARPSELVAFRGKLVPAASAPRPSLLSIAPVRGPLVGRQTMVPISAKSDDFLGPSLPRGSYHVDVFFPGAPTPWRQTLELDGRESNLVVPGRGSLRLELELPAEATLDQAEAFVRVRAPLETYWIHAPIPRDPRDAAFVTELMPGTYWVIVLLEGHAAECVKARVEEGRETLLSVAPRKGTPITIQVVAPRALEEGEVLRLEVAETERRVPVPFFREAPGERNTWWAGVEVSADAQQIVATSRGLMGELRLTPELVRPGAVLRIELEERGSGPR